MLHCENDRLMLNPLLGQGQTMDVTDAIIRAVAHQLHETHQGNEHLNWLEAEQSVRAFCQHMYEMHAQHNTAAAVEPAAPERQIDVKPTTAHATADAASTPTPPMTITDRQDAGLNSDTTMHHAA